MSKSSFNIEKSLHLKPIDPSTVVAPKNGEIICDSTDLNKLKKYNETNSTWEALAGSANSITADPGVNIDITTPDYTLDPGDIILKAGSTTDNTESYNGGSVTIEAGDATFGGNQAGRINVIASNRGVNFTSKNSLGVVSPNTFYFLPELSQIQSTNKLIFIANSGISLFSSTGGIELNSAVSTSLSTSIDISTPSQAIDIDSFPITLTTGAVSGIGVRGKIVLDSPNISVLGKISTENSATTPLNLQIKAGDTTDLTGTNNGASVVIESGAANSGNNGGDIDLIVGYGAGSTNGFVNIKGKDDLGVLNTGYMRIVANGISAVNQPVYLYSNTHEVSFHSNSLINQQSYLFRKQYFDSFSSSAHLISNESSIRPTIADVDASVVVPFAAVLVGTLRRYKISYFFKSVTGSPSSNANAFLEKIAVVNNDNILMITQDSMTAIDPLLSSFVINVTYVAGDLISTVNGLAGLTSKQLVVVVTEEAF